MVLVSLTVLWTVGAINKLLIDHQARSASVVVCAPQIVAMVVTQTGRQLSYEAALAFCAALEAAPLIEPVKEI